MESPRRPSACHTAPTSRCSTSASAWRPKARRYPSRWRSPEAFHLLGWESVPRAKRLGLRQRGDPPDGTKKCGIRTAIDLPEGFVGGVDRVRLISNMRYAHNGGIGPDSLRDLRKVSANNLHSGLRIPRTNHQHVRFRGKGVRRYYPHLDRLAFMDKQFVKHAHIRSSSSG